VDTYGSNGREREESSLREMLEQLTPGNITAGRLMRKRMLRMLEEQIAPAAVDLFIWDMELTGELNPSSCDAASQPDVSPEFPAADLRVSSRHFRK